MLQPGYIVLLSVSGGCDSLALFKLLLKLQPLFDLKLHVFHLNHKLRKEAEADALFVEKLAKREKVPCYVVTYDVPFYIKKHGLSVQEGARKIRYQVLEEVADRIGADCIALGHHTDDQAETVLMWLLRGSGAEGLTGIPPVRGRYIRPLIEVRRSELEEYCRTQGLKPRLDLSNFNLGYKRNRIRFDLIPYLSSRYQPRLVEVLSRTGQILADENAMITELTEAEFKKIIKKQGKEFKLYLPAFLKLPLAIKRRLLRRVIGEIRGDLKGVEFKHIESLISYVSRNHKQVLDLPAGISVFYEYDYLVITSPEEKIGKIEIVELNVPGCTKIEALGLEISATLVENQGEIEKIRDLSIALLDFDRLTFPLKVRYRQEGDAFQPLGMKNIKKLQDFLVDKKIPRRERDRIPLVESGNQIVWVGGYRIDERFKIASKTKKILKLELK